MPNHTTNIQNLSVEQLRAVLHDLHRALARAEANSQNRRALPEPIDRVEKMVAAKSALQSAPQPWFR